MRYSAAFVVAAVAASASAHGVITEIYGANDVIMPGLNLIDGTPRDCGTPFCGSEDDTLLVRAREFGGRSSAIGRTLKGGPVDAGKAIEVFMGTRDPPTKREEPAKLEARQNNNPMMGPVPQGGVRTARGTRETAVARFAGMGASTGLPTASDDGVISVTYHQVNQDGAGPLDAQIDPSSGGTDPAAFVRAQIIQNVPGTIGGLSLAAARDWPVKIQMPEGMVCSGKAGGAENVCIVRVANTALAGPFGGAAAFTQSNAGVKRAVDFNLKKRHIARGLVASQSN